MERSRKLEPKRPDWPPEKTLRLLKQQLAELMTFKGRRYQEADRQENAWEQFTRSAIIHGFGEESQNVRNFYVARAAGIHNIMGISDDQRQANFELRIEKFEATLTSSIKELEVMLPEPEIEARFEVAAVARGEKMDKAGQGEPYWDVFISHASEDKEAIARPLADALKATGLTVWYDDFSLKVGDSLCESIDRGLARSRFGVVILSPHFFEKHWPKQELNGLATREVDGKKVILPVWHKVGFKEVGEYSPTLADRVAVSTEKGPEYVFQRILNAVTGSFPAAGKPTG